MFKLKNIYHRISIILFGNRIGIFNNLVHIIYHFICKVNYKLFAHRLRSNEDQREKIETLKKKGFTVLSMEYSDSLKQIITKKVSEGFQAEEKLVKTHLDGGLIRLKDSLVNVPELLNLFQNEELKSVIEGYFGSLFEIHNSDIYRIQPTSEFGGVSSHHWHFDNASRNMLKCFVYLNDTTIKNGALTLTDKVIGNRLKRRGFWRRERVGPFLDEIQSNSIRIEGKEFTVVLFTPQFCVHKSTPPEEGFRISAVFLLYPTLIEPDYSDSAWKELAGKKFGYMLNPLSKRSLRVGME